MPIRRSARVANKNTAERYKAAVTSDSESEPESNDSDFEETSAKRKKPQRKAVSKRSKTVTGSGRRKGSRPRTAISFQQLEAELVENTLYQSLAHPEVDIQDVAVEWVDSYNDDIEGDNTNVPITTLINLLLRSCGSLHLFNPHDLVNLESAAETVAELVIAFSDQQSHKFPFKALPTFKKNVLKFLEEVIQIAHEKGLLYRYENGSENQDENDEQEESLSSPFMTQILTWMSSLSSCTIRPLRYTSTVALLTIQNQLCHIINNVISSMDRSKKQLSATKKANKKRIETLTKTVKSYHTQKNTIIEYFNEIGNVTLGHRYRDIDPLIRQECLRFLSQAMIIHPDHFFEASFLRYFGWLLSDPSNGVRHEVTRVLSKLYKNVTSRSQSNVGMNRGLSQFTARYKKQLIKMSTLDSDLNVRYNCIGICCELLTIGYLDQQDIHEVIAIFFEIILESKNISKLNNLRLRSELARFVSIVNEQQVKEQHEQYSMFFENYESGQFGEGEDQLKIRDCMKIKNLVSILKDATTYYFESVNEHDSRSRIESDIKNKNVISVIYSTLYQLPYYTNTWETLIRYLLLDPSSIKFISTSGGAVEEDNQEVKDFIEGIDISKDDRSNKLHLLNFIDGAFNSLVATKSKQDELSSVILVKLVKYLPELQSLSIKYPDSLKVFLQLWNLLIGLPLDTLNIYSIFNGLNQIQSYNEVNCNLIKFFKEYEFNEVDDDALITQYDMFFGKLLEFYSTEKHSGGIDVLTTDIRLQVQDFVYELVSEVKNVITSANNSFIDEDEDELRDQRNIIERIIQVSQPILKLRKIGDSINLNEFLDANMVDMIVFRLLSKFKLSVLIEKWRSNLMSNIKPLVSGIKDILDLILILISWKLEKLIGLESSASEQAAVDIEVEFANVYAIVSAISNNITEVDRNIKELADQQDYQMFESLNSLKTVFSVKLIDLLVSMKIFYIKFDTTTSNFKNFEDYFGNVQEMGKFVSKILPSELQYQLLDTFLFKEARVASALEVNLDRGDEEDVNYDDFVGAADDESESADELSRSMFDSDNEEGQGQISDRAIVKKAKKSSKLWQLEKELCVYTVKLFSLVNTSMVNNFVSERIELNSEKLGGVFLKIVKQNQQQQLQAENSGVANPSEAENGEGAVPTNETTEANNIEGNRQEIASV
ncbi:hypothetical protein PICST_28736 [Scheffersomyces stipitis CBS 6054]|uniref:SCD domain-containing protein n=1 Tax=Scheffersomyces stipitis (strain ATCC 58785 / CBS 6054 / NBRC 10063 / NRRL Y-11545) TaxID=322104 RepID=A3GGT9_PICST|nr:predicted protein [Scheffersomyces stipitis CBS 6054]EAZ63979.2 hypothetical protein PICST_28736 [Scheffersomyces stipitis CBS 6054]